MTTVFYVGGSDTEKLVGVVYGGHGTGPLITDKDRRDGGIGTYKCTVGKE